jgi:hypothetical protein
VIVEPILELSLAFHREGSFVTHEAAQRAFNPIIGRVWRGLDALSPYAAVVIDKSQHSLLALYSRSSSFIIHLFVHDGDGGALSRGCLSPNRWDGKPKYHYDFPCLSHSLKRVWIALRIKVAHHCLRHRRLLSMLDEPGDYRANGT